LASLGLQDVPIGVGTKVSTNEESKYKFDSALMPDMETFQPNKDSLFEDSFELLDLIFNKLSKKIGKSSPFLYRP